MAEVRTIFAPGGDQETTSYFPHISESETDSWAGGGGEPAREVVTEVYGHWVSG